MNIICNNAILETMWNSSAAELWSFQLRDYNAIITNCNYEGHTATWKNTVTILNKNYKSIYCYDYNYIEIYTCGKSLDEKETKGESWLDLE